MDYEELNDMASKLHNPKDMLQLINKFFNTGGDTSMQLYLEGKGHYAENDNRPLQDWHPTLQQCLMRGFIVPAIKALADDPHPDERNQGTVKMCMEILPILEKHRLSFIHVERR